MSWLLIMEILIKDTKTGCGRVTVFSLVTNMLSIPFALGEASSESVVTSQLLLSHSLYVGSLLAWFFPNWVDFQLSVTLLCGSGILVLLYIPESPVWLILHGKRLEYEATMMEAAEINGRDIDGRLRNGTRGERHRSCQAQSVVSAPQAEDLLSHLRLGGHGSDILRYNVTSCHLLDTHTQELTVLSRN